MHKMDHMKTPTASEISALRKRVGWSQQDVAVMLDLSVSWVSKCEQGKETLSWKDWLTLRVLAAAEVDKKRWPPPPDASEILMAA